MVVFGMYPQELYVVHERSVVYPIIIGRIFMIITYLGSGMRESSTRWDSNFITSGHLGEFHDPNTNHSNVGFQGYLDTPIAGWLTMENPI